MSQRATSIPAVAPQMKCPRYGIAQKCRVTLELGGATLMVVAVQQKAQGDLEDFCDLMWIRLQNEGRAYDAHDRPTAKPVRVIYLSR